MSAPVPLVDWLATDDEWRAARRRGCSASDVAALLGFNRRTSPWALWADKTGHPMAPVDDGNEAARLGSALEPWLLDTGAPMVIPSRWPYPMAARAPQRLYQHAEHPWRLCTPDGFWFDETPRYRRAGGVTDVDLFSDAVEGELIETKTAGLQTGRALGWTDTTIPLGYELQTRWQMHVMDAPVCHVVALVAGRGLCHYPITRDLETEAELVRQVSAWWERHVVEGVEPPLSGGDATMIAAVYPKVWRKTVDLDDTLALTHWQEYLSARDDEKEAADRKAEAGTALKALLGDAHTGLVDGRPIATWGERKGRIDWEKLARELYGQLVEVLNATDPAIARLTMPFPMTRCLRCGQDMPFELHQAHAAVNDCEPVTELLPKLDALAEQHRSPTTRTLTVKD